MFVPVDEFLMATATVASDRRPVGVSARVRWDERPRHQILVWIAVAVAAAASLGLVVTGVTAASITNSVTVGVLAVTLVRGDKWRDALARTRRLLLTALGAAFVSGMLPVAYTALTGHPPPRPWLSDGVALAYVPFTIAALLAIPTASRRTGYRARALADGLLAATSLWYLLATLTLAHRGTSSGWATAVILAYPVGDVFVVSTALAVLARCPCSARRIVGWIVAGLSLVAANDVWQSVAAKSTTTAVGVALTYQGGLLLLLGAASAPAVVRVTNNEQPSTTAWLFGVVPFLPLFACMGTTTQMIVAGAGMPPAKVVPALAVAVALTARQFAASRDKARLIDQLTVRERHLEAALGEMT